MEKNIEYYMKLPYTIVIKQDTDNNDEICFIARVLEIPHCLGDGKTPEEAVECLEIHKRMTIEAYLKDGISIPEPQTHFSGNINLRVDPELHGKLTQEAMINDMSLNKYAALILERRGKPFTIKQETRGRGRPRKSMSPA